MMENLFNECMLCLYLIKTCNTYLADFGKSGHNFSINQLKVNVCYYAIFPK